LEYADARRVPVVPFGAGTSLEGHVIPLHGGISLDLTRLASIVALRPDDLTATVQAGVTRSQLEAAAGPHGLWFPVDPGADATLGGMAATNASGTTSVRYGGMRAHVLALEVVLAGGRVVRTGSRAVKTSAGYNLTHLFVGSEGTLGVITELTLRLHPIPDHIVVERAPTARAQMWEARHSALMAALAQASGSKAMTTDVAVPVSELAAAIEHARSALDASSLSGGIVGHVGDGNFHVAFLLDPEDGR